MPSKGHALDIHPTEKQYLAYQALNDPNIHDIYFGGGAGGGKTWLGAESRVARAYAYPGYKSFIGRNELKRLLSTSYITLLKVLRHHKIPREDWHMNRQYNFVEFRNGSRIDLLDLSWQPSDPMYERLGSYEFTDGGWTDEAGEVPFMAIDILQSRGGRHLNEEYGIEPDSLYTFNPNKGWVYRIYKAWKEGTLPKDSVFIQSLFGDNPYTADIYGRQLQRIKDPAMRQRLMLGSFEYDSDPTALMDYDSILDIFTNTVSGDTEKAMTIDVARHGVDKTVIYLWKGWTIYGVRIYAKQDTAVTSQKARDISDEEEIPFSRTVVDEDGIGGAVVDTNKGYKGFIANSRALDNPNNKDETPENYANLNSQCSFVIAEKVNKHGVAVKIEEGQFISEVPGVTFEVWKEQMAEEMEHVKSRDADRDTKLKVNQKEDVKAAIGRSPDFWDTLKMRAMLEYPNSIKVGGSGVTVHRPSFKGFNRRGH